MKRIFIACSMALCLNATVLSGIVKDAQTMIPIEGAQVTVGGLTSLTDEHGAFTYDKINAPLVIKYPGYRRKLAEVPAEQQQFLLDSFTPRGIYVSLYGIAHQGIRERAMDLVRKGEVNTFVIDVKNDEGYLLFDTGVPMAETLRAHNRIGYRDIRVLMEELQQNNIYTIARIAVFKDGRLGRDRLYSVKRPDGSKFYDRQGVPWTDPFFQTVRDYNIQIAKKAAEAGFDEIQFDYVRFPDHKGLVYLKESNQDSRVKTISGFLGEARKQLTPYNVFVSADIFGYSLWNKGDIGLGQHLETLAKNVDYVSPMLYPSGFGEGIPEYPDPIENAYEVIYHSLEKAKERTGLEGVRFRPWLQAFKDYAFDKRHFKAEMVCRQVAASEDSKSHGWLLWNPRNVYENIFPVYSTEYPSCRPDSLFSSLEGNHSLTRPQSKLRGLLYR